MTEEQSRQEETRLENRGCHKRSGDSEHVTYEPVPLAATSVERKAGIPA